MRFYLYTLDSQAEIKKMEPFKETPVEEITDYSYRTILLVKPLNSEALARVYFEQLLNVGCWL